MRLVRRPTSLVNMNPHFTPIEDAAILKYPNSLNQFKPYRPHS